MWKQDAHHRNAHLFFSCFDGILISLENVFFMSTLSLQHIRDQLINVYKYDFKGTDSQVDFMHMSYLSSESLFNIRHKSKPSKSHGLDFERSRKSQFHRSFDNLSYFCRRFDLDYESHK